MLVLSSAMVAPLRVYTYMASAAQEIPDFFSSEAWVVTLMPDTIDGGN
jgi:hypothetical protein